MKIKKAFEFAGDRVNLVARAALKGYKALGIEATEITIGGTWLVGGEFPINGGGKAVVKIGDSLVHVEKSKGKATLAVAPGDGEHGPATMHVTCVLEGEEVKEAKEKK